MQPRAFLFVALLAPHSAAAFGDLDCISIESCSNSGCAPATVPFALSFDWSSGEATVLSAGVATTLPLTSPITTQTDGADQMQTVVEYGTMDSDLNHLLRVEATGNEIFAYWTFKDPLVTTVVAQCDRRQAA